MAAKFIQVIAYHDQELSEKESLVALDSEGQVWQRIYFHGRAISKEDGRWCWVRLSMELREFDQL